MAMITPTVFPSGVAGICDVLLELLELKQKKKGGGRKETNNASEAMGSE
jgi:hypothetical protein